MHLDDFRADSSFLQQFCRGQEEIVEESPFGGVEVIDEFNESKIFESQIAEPLANVGPVLLFDMGVVIFFVGSGSSKLDGLRSILEVSDEMPLEELGTVVAVKAEDIKGQRSLDGNNLLQDATLSFTPDSALLSPSGGDISDIETEDKLSRHRVATVSDGIGLQEARSCLIPLIGFDRDMLLEQLTWLGGGESLALNTQSLLDKQPIDGARGYFSQSLLDPSREDSEGLLIRLDPVLQDSFEALRAGIVCALPDTGKHDHDFRLAVA